MINGKDYWCFSILGKPKTKKRPRIFNNCAFTEDSWYEQMIRDAFHRMYPNMKPIGYEYYDIRTRKYKGRIKEYYSLKKQYSVKDLPTVRLFIFIYINDGMIGDDDNYVKAISDALNKTLYMDDKMVKVPTPYTIVDDCEEERVDVLAIKYYQTKDKTLKRLQKFISKHKKEIDIYEEYEDVRLHELTIDQLYSKLCKHLDCPKWETCNYRRKDDIIYCKLREKLNNE